MFLILHNPTKSFYVFLMLHNPTFDSTNECVSLGYDRDKMEYNKTNDVIQQDSISGCIKHVQNWGTSWYIHDGNRVFVTMLVESLFRCGDDHAGTISREQKTTIWLSGLNSRRMWPGWWSYCIVLPWKKSRIFYWIYRISLPIGWCIGSTNHHPGWITYSWYYPLDNIYNIIYI